MSYYEILGLTREPFSTSPDPSFFFLSREHKAALCRLQISIKLRRGMSVILGDVGTGKTTLSRRLSQELRDDRENVHLHMILNPYFKNETEFLERLCLLFHIDVPPESTRLDYMEAVERYLFHVGVEQNRTIVLLIDEAQILPDFVLETLRILLNYETNEYKILQLILLGQMELLPRIRDTHNFWDRIALRYILHPLGEEEVRDMLDFRLRQAGYNSAMPLFTNEAVHRIYDFTKGYLRKLTLLCHNCVEYLVMYEKRLIDEDIVDEVIRTDFSEEFGFNWDPVWNPDKVTGVGVQGAVSADATVKSRRLVLGGATAGAPRLKVVG